MLEKLNKFYPRAHGTHTLKIQYIHIYFTKSEESSRWILTHIFFDSEIILIFGGLFLHRLSRILKVNLKWIRVTMTDSEIQRYTTRS